MAFRPWEYRTDTGSAGYEVDMTGYSVAAVGHIRVSGVWYTVGPRQRRRGPVTANLPSFAAAGSCLRRSLRDAGPSVRNDRDQRADPAGCRW